MLIVRCLGGLGNQMFQYAFYQYLKSCNSEVYFDISDFKVHNHHNGFELKKVFNKVDYDLPECRPLKKIAISRNSIAYRLILKKLGIKYIRTSEFIETFNGITVERCNYQNDIYFDGYWQNAKYSMEIENTLREKFADNTNYNQKNRKLIDEMASCNSVSIHIRRGDYVGNTSLGGICDESYYRIAVDRIKKFINNYVFFVFSDDVEWIKTNFRWPNSTVFVDWNRKEDSYLDMLLMSKCQHNIIANSSFSWWAAWLNNNPDKIVIMPKQWYIKQDYNPLFVDGWIQV